MKRLILSGVILLATVFMIAAAADSYDGRYLLYEVNYTLNADGSWVREVHTRFQYNSHTATRRMGETFIEYNPRFQKLDAIRSVTTMADGTKVPLPDNALNPVLPRVAHNHAGFSHLREMVVTHTGLERGATVDFSYRLTTDAGFQPGFSAAEQMCLTLPTDRLVIRVKAAPGKQLVYAAPMEAEPQISSRDGMKTWTWTRENVAPAWSERMMPSGCTPVLLLGEKASWKSLLGGLNENIALPESLKESIQKTTRETSSVVDRMVRIGGMVDRVVELCRVPLDLSGFKFRNPEEVWTARSGTAGEKALITHAALKSAGLKSTILIYSDQGWMDSAGPVLPQIGGFLVEVRDESDTCWYLDPQGNMHGVIPHSLAGRVMYRVGEDRFERLAQDTPDDNRIEMRGEWKIDSPEKASGWIEISISGAWVDYPKAMDDPAGFAEKLLKRVLPVQKVETEAVREVTPLSLRVKFKIASLKTDRLSSGIYILDSPKIATITPDIIAADRRISPMEFLYPFRVSARISVVTGDHVTLEYIRDDAMVETRGVIFSGSAKQSEDKSLQLNWDIQVLRRIEAAGYEEFRSAIARYINYGPWLTLMDGHSR